MANRKLSKFASVMLLCFGASACAQLSDGLQAVNDTLAGINSGLAGTTGNVPSTFSLGTKTTGEYELSNLKMSVKQLGYSYASHLSQSEVTFTGEARNKTSRLLVIGISVPMYDKQGRYVTSAMVDIHIPAKERVKIDKMVRTSPLEDGNRFNTQKAKYQVTRY